MDRGMKEQVLADNRSDAQKNEHRICDQRRSNRELLPAVTQLGRCVAKVGAHSKAIYASFRSDFEAVAKAEHSALASGLVEPVRNYYGGYIKYC